MQQPQLSLVVPVRGAFPRIVACAPLLLLYLFSGFCLQALPVVAPSILLEWHVPANALATPLALEAIGMGVGAVIGGILGDARGRKVPIVAFCALQGLAIFGISFVHKPLGLYPLMLVNGIGVGGYFASGMALITELAPVRQRGLMVSLAMLFGPLGLSLCSVVAGVLAPAYGWYALFVVGGAAAIPLLLSVILLLPESPRYLARFEDRAEARRRIVARLGLSEDDEPALVDRPNVSAVGVLLGWVPVVLSSLHFPIAFASSSLFYWTVGNLVGTVSSGWCISRYGVFNTSVIYGAGAVGVYGLLTVLKLDPSMREVLMVLLPMAGLCMSGVVTSIYTLAAEFYPTVMRATGIGMADALGRVGGVGGAFVGITALDRGGAAGFFGAILGLSAMAFAILVVLRIRYGRHSAHLHAP